MDGETPKTPGHLLVTGFYMSKFSEKAVARIPSHSFPKVNILDSQDFDSFSAIFKRMLRSAI